VRTLHRLPLILYQPNQTPTMKATHHKTPHLNKNMVWQIYKPFQLVKTSKMSPVVSWLS